MNADIPILHHYTPSPFSEKVRKVLAYKQLPWRSVQIPPVMPKPDLMPLTGGYRKTPVMQVGRDIYCDSKLICRVIDRLRPERPLIPPGQEAATLMIERWVDQTFFFDAVALFFQPAGLAAFGAGLPPVTIDTFLKDRGAMFAQGGTLPPPKMDIARAELPAILSSLEAQFAIKPFLGGDAPTQIDFAVYNPVWFIYGNAGISAELNGFPKLRAWTERILAFGEGPRTEMEGRQAVEICRAAKVSQAPLPGTALALPQAKLGDQVKIGAADYAPDQVQGELVIANAFELAVRREDPRAGTVIVHFPPEGFTLAKA
ncbi:MAG: glutathione S-transferase family protein [Panacagrimonas sp.]